ncbi:MAG TPA: FAD-binding oxidoreductase [Gammaproteobacteria bacterium]|nr:FAD-binding oxidoreductase [Gammaproteobacteria bacterium]
MTDYEESYYSATRNAALGDTGMLRGHAHADVCVVGGGISGCSAALHLAERGYKVSLLEAARIGCGASGRSGGQIIPGLSTDVGQFRRSIGEDAVRALWEMTCEAVALVRRRVAEHQIDCDLKWGYVHAATRTRHMRELEAWHSDLVRNFNYDAMQLLDKNGLGEHVRSSRYMGGVHQKDAGHLHPLNYTLGLGRAAQAAGVRIHEDSRAAAVEHGTKVRARTAEGEIEADYVLLCGNAYINGVASEIENKVMPVSTYILGTEPLSEGLASRVLPQDDAVADLNVMLDYYRLSADRRMLFGGRVSYTGRQPRNLEGALRRRMSYVFPQLADVRTDFIWGGLVGVTLNRAPHFGRLSRNVFFAQGFSGHGMALTGLAGQLLAEAVAGQAERFDVFARIPHKNFPGGRSLGIPLRVLGTLYYRLRDLL